MIDKYGEWTVFLAAGVVGATGAMMSAFAPSLHLVIIGHGVIYGLTFCATFAAAITLVSKLFVYNRPVATAATFASMSLGSIIDPIMIHGLIEKYTIRGVFTVLAGFFLNFIPLGYFLFTIRNHVLVKRENKQEEVASLSKNVTETTELTKTREQTCKALKSYFKTLFSFRCIALTLYYIAYAFGVFGHIMYVPAYAEELSISPLDIATILTVYGALELTSIILIGLACNFLPINIYKLAAVNCAIVGCFDLLVPISIQSGFVYLPMIINVATVGLFAGGLDTLLGNQVADNVGTDMSGSLVGLLSVGFGIGLILPSIIYGMLNILVLILGNFLIVE